MKVSVIICTYNPRKSYLARVIQALRHQSLNPTEWELIIVDNNSIVSVNSSVDLKDSFPNFKIVVEHQQGLTHARLRGIKESCADLLCFVDDDNELRYDYLETGLNIAQSHAFLGAFSGNSIPEYERGVLPVSKLDLNYLLALRHVERDWWSNSYHSGCKPIGAGMFVRRIIANRYTEILANSSVRSNLDRMGESLISAGDSDLAMVSVDMGYGYGLFIDLHLAHLIPERRVEKSYLIRLSRNMQLSSMILNYVRFEKLPDRNIRSVKTILVKIYLYFWYSRFDNAILNADKWAVKVFYKEYYKS